MFGNLLKSHFTFATEDSKLRLLNFLCYEMDNKPFSPLSVDTLVLLFIEKTVYI